MQNLLGIGATQQRGSFRRSTSALARKGAENGAFENKVPVNPSPAELLAAYRRAEADAAHKAGLIQLVSKKGPKAIQAAMETAAKATKRRDSFAKKLTALGLDVKD